MHAEHLNTGALPLILTVLRSGGEYTPLHVERLAVQCAHYAPMAAFRCISDVDVPGWVTMRHGWPGWWAKMEIFRFRGPVLYMDLDTTIVDDLEPLLDVARDHPFVGIRDFNPGQRTFGSGLMAWNGDQRGLYRMFAHAPARHMEANSTPRHWGDQGFIERHTRPAFWQDVLPDAVVSFKKHCREGVPPGARVVAFHGKPKPWEVGQ